MRRTAGFAVAWMLVLVAIIALAGGGALHDVWFAQQLANTRAYQQRAMGMAELGLRMGMLQLANAATPPFDSGVQHPGAAQTDSLQLKLRPGIAQIPTGFSAGRFISRDYEIESTGRSVRAAQRVLTQGVTRRELVTETAP
jgi:Tfp pilus assembly protein PilX